MTGYGAMQLLNSQRLDSLCLIICKYGYTVCVFSLFLGEAVLCTKLVFVWCIGPYYCL